MKQALIYLTTLLWTILLPFFASATETDTIDELHIEKASIEEIENTFKAYNYSRFLYLKDKKVPAIFLQTMPDDFDKIKPLKYKNNLFIRILLPLALKVNEEITTERKEVLRLEKEFANTSELSKEDIESLETLSKKYDFFTRKKDKAKIEDEIRNLKKRVNIIPPSILIAIAALETDWGSSRLVKEANSLYKEKVWYTDDGLIPIDNPDDGYRFKIFNSLIDSMRSFALTFNSNLAYQNIWTSREETEKRNPFIYGESIAYSLATTSNLPNYAGIIDYTSAFYDFANFDSTQLKRGLKKNEP